MKHILLAIGLFVSGHIYAQDTLTPSIFWSQYTSDDTNTITLTWRYDTKDTTFCVGNNCIEICDPQLFQMLHETIEGINTDRFKPRKLPK